MCIGNSFKMSVREEFVPFPKKSKKKSEVWNHFSVKLIDPTKPAKDGNFDMKYVFCNYCRKTVHKPWYVYSKNKTMKTYTTLYVTLQPQDFSLIRTRSKIIKHLLIIKSQNT